ncbi:MAG: L-ribulose-5-phosphate 3-epimerase [Chloroflexi bacterium]|nr:L-ribulose-5-phosphate 3-epimerase [Chloroflexota bacterium]
MIPIGLYEKALPAEWSWPRRLAATAEAGYDFAEISIDETDERLGRLDWGPKERGALRRAIENSGVRILTMCLSALRTFPLGSHTPGLRLHSLTILRKAIAFAADVGLGIVQVPGYDAFYEPQDADTASLLLDGLRQGAEWASENCLMLGLENVDVPISESIHATMRLVDAVRSPWVQIYPDMANVAAAGFHPPDELRLAKDHIVAVHVKDGLPHTIRGVPYGEGIVPFAATFAALRESAFRGPLIVEMWASMDRTGDPFSAARAARVFVRPYQEVLDAAGKTT